MVVIAVFGTSKNIVCYELASVISDEDDNEGLRLCKDQILKVSLNLQQQDTPE